MLNELIAEFPNVERTKSVLNNIHAIIERFRQLREEFSTFDSNGNATLVNRRKEDYKPLAKTLLSLNQKLFWILPVSKNIRKFYNVDSSNVTDFTVTTIEESIEQENALTDDYLTNKDSFVTYINKMNEYITPYTTPDAEFGFSQFVNTNITSILDNLTDFYSSIVKGEQIKRNQFIIQTYNLGLTQIQTRKVKSFGKRVADITDVLPLTRNDTINVTSFISLPEPVMNFSNISLPNTSILTRANLGKHFVPYWNLLRKNTSITRKAISLEEKEGEDQYGVDDMINFTSNFVSFVADQEIDSEEKYKKFVEMLIPSTGILFDTMNKYVTGEITLSNYVAVLQPFLIYVHDLTLKQYEVVVSMIAQRVSEYRKKVVQSSREYAALSTAKYAAKYAGSSALYNLLKDSKQVNFDTDILDIYKFNGSAIEVVKTGVAIPTAIPILSGSTRVFKDLVFTGNNVYMITGMDKNLYKLNGNSFEIDRPNLTVEQERITSIEGNSNGLLLAISKTLNTQPQPKTVSDVILLPN